MAAPIGSRCCIPARAGQPIGKGQRPFWLYARRLVARKDLWGGKPATVDGSTVVSTGDLVHAVRGLEPGSAVDLEVWRDGTLQTLAATLGERQWPGPHTMVVHCGGEGDDCPEIAALESFSCAGDPGCKIEIVCADDGCKCAVNGEATECETLPGFVAPGE